MYADRDFYCSFSFWVCRPDINLMRGSSTFLCISTCYVTNPDLSLATLYINVVSVTLLPHCVVVQLGQRVFHLHPNKSIRGLIPASSSLHQVSSFTVWESLRSIHARCRAKFIVKTLQLHSDCKIAHEAVADIFQYHRFVREFICSLCVAISLLYIQICIISQQIWGCHNFLYWTIRTKLCRTGILWESLLFPEWLISFRTLRS